MAKIRLDENGNKLTEEQIDLEVSEQNKIAKKEDKKEKTFNSSLDKQFDESKTAQGVLLSFLLLIFAPIYGAVKYPKGTYARKTYMRASIITLLVLALLATLIGVLCYIFITGLVTLVQGTTEGVVDGIIDGAKNIITLIK